MNALFIGRFQPFHLGHLYVIKNFYNKYDKLYIGIGSSQYHHTSENPFTFEERKSMIEKTLQPEHIHNCTIIAIPDIHDPPHWVDHVRSIIDDFSVILSNNGFTTSLFERKGFDSRQTDLFHRSEHEGTLIRKRIKQQKKWDHLVPKQVYEYIKSIDGEKRISQL